MDWFISLLTENSIAHTLVIYSFIIAVGVMLGKIKIAGISLGVTFVLFVGILVAHFGFNVEPSILNFVKEFGLILFIFSIGLQVGPGFFASFKKGGMLLTGLSVLLIILGIGTAIGLYYIFDGRISMPIMVGILQGAVTNTPGLGAAQEALRQLGDAAMVNGEVPPIGLGYAVAYPIGVIGIITTMLLFRLFFRVKLEDEEMKLEKENESQEKPYRMTVKITNHAINGKNLINCKAMIQRPFVASRLWNGSEMCIPEGKTLLHEGDLLLIVTTQPNAEAILAFLGEEADYEWNDDESTMASRRIVITQNNINGKTIGTLHLRSAFGVNITRVNRAGVDLLATPNLVLQVGDRVMVVGPLEAIKKAESMLGNTLKRLYEPHLITIFVGILLGILVGSVPFYFGNMPMPAKLGLAGGPLIIAILIGRFGYKFKLITYTTQSANLMLREMGICLFLASVGLASGGQFVETVVSEDGLLWIACGAIITMVPALIVGIIGHFCHLNYFTLIGMIAGTCTNPPALAYANSVSSSGAPAVGYSTVYPLAMFLRIICAQFIILAFA